MYSSKFQFHVIELSKLKSTKGKARKQELYRWAKLISASTWEEVREAWKTRRGIIKVNITNTKENSKK